MKHCRPLPPLEVVREALNYDPETGVFTWRKRPCQRMRAGEIAGTLHPSGYRLIRLGMVGYRAHRLAFLLMEGREPREVIDHINGDKSDNRWSNIREVTQLENCWNIPDRYRDAGVSQQASGKWSARITVAGKDYWLGQFDTEDGARVAYEEAWHALRRAA